MLTKCTAQAATSTAEAQETTRSPHEHAKSESFSIFPPAAASAPRQLSGLLPQALRRQPAALASARINASPTKQERPSAPTHSPLTSPVYHHSTPHSRRFLSSLNRAGSSHTQEQRMRCETNCKFHGEAAQEVVQLPPVWALSSLSTRTATHFRLCPKFWPGAGAVIRVNKAF